MRVAAVQFKARKGQFQESLSALCKLTQRAAQDADLVVLPEMAVTGYCFDSRDEVAAIAEPDDGPTCQALSPIAAEQHCWIVAGFPEKAGDQLFNSALILDPSGTRRFTYRKTLLYEADLPWATPGDSGYARFETGQGAFGVGICMDLNDDRFITWCRGAALQAVAFPTNWVDEGDLVWPYWAWRMQGTEAALVAANTYGREVDTRFSGRSAIIKGRQVLAHAPYTGDGVIRASLST